MPRIDEYGIDEFMAVAMAQCIRDGEVVFNGVSVALPLVAMLLAKATHAPRMVVIGGLQGAVNPRPPFLPPVGLDWTMLRGADAVVPTPQIFQWAMAGRLDLLYLGGGQLDQYGNTNNSLIRDPGREVKLPGGAGASSLSCYARRFVIWTTRHRSKGDRPLPRGHTFVPLVDWVTGVGHRTHDSTRTALGLQGRGPAWVVTNLGVFDFESSSGRMRFRQRFPDVTIDDVRASTGFEVVVDGAVEEVPAPTRAEISVLRRLDPLAVRRREFPSSELSRLFRRFS